MSCAKLKRKFKWKVPNSTPYPPRPVDNIQADLDRLQAEWTKLDVAY